MASLAELVADALGSDQRAPGARCSACGAYGPFMVTIDRVLHRSRGHLAVVVDRDGNAVRFDSESSS